MQLDCARELKKLLTEQVLAPLHRPAAMRSLAVAAQPAAQVRRIQPTIALGIAKMAPGDFQLAVRLQHRGMESSPELDTIRKEARGEVDLRYVGTIRKQIPRASGAPAHQQRDRPLRIGGSLGHYAITCGTLGGFVQARSGKAAMILSNNHVLANENNGKTGDAILQPGAYDGGKPSKDTVATLASFVKLKAAGVNLVDCAVATVKAGVAYDHQALIGLGKLAGLGDAFLDEGAEVAKVGRTTGVTHGRVTAFEMDGVSIEYGMGLLRFDGQIEIESAGPGPFSDGGDSGSLIVNAEHRGVALLFAGSDQGGSNGRGLTYASPLRAVLDALKADLLY